MASTLILSLVALISLLTTIPSSMSFPKTPLKGFEARLIHRDSPESPLYNPKATRAQLLKSSHRRATSRQTYLKWLMSAKTWRQNYISVPVDVEHGDYIMRYKIGTPAIDTFGIFDTGSTLIWLQCQPCEKCYNQSVPIYDPKTSSTYEQATCYSRACSMTPDTQCPDRSPYGVCTYSVGYVDGGSSQGVIAKETITLDNDAPMPLVVFGCGHNNSDPQPGYNPPGIVGASRGSSSLVGQVASYRFSYCISPYNEGNRSSVKLGSEAVIHEKEFQTRLIYGEDDDLFHLSLEGISVGGEKVNVSKSGFNMSQDGIGDFIMDSGSTYTFLVPEAFYALKQALEIAASYQLLQPDPDPERYFPLCYSEVDFLILAPGISLHFAGGLEFPVTPNNVWEVDEETGKTCLAMKPNYSGNYSVFGLYQHRSVNVGYDLNNNVVSLKHSYMDDCLF